MTLGEKQRKFSLAAAKLIVHAYELGYEVTLGDAYRDPRVFGAHGTKRAYGRAESNHKLRLAIDLNLFKDGQFLTATSDHAELGKWWEDTFLSDGAAWGGHFGDGNHYSFKHNGNR